MKTTNKSEWVRGHQRHSNHISIVELLRSRKCKALIDKLYKNNSAGTIWRTGVQIR